MESSFSYLSLSVSVLHFRTNSTDMELCHSDRVCVCVCAQHCWCLQQLCMSLCISTTSYSPVKVCNDSGLFGCVSHVEVIVASCCCLYAPHSCLNLYWIIRFNFKQFSAVFPCLECRCRLFIITSSHLYPWVAVNPFFKLSFGSSADPFSHEWPAADHGGGGQSLGSVGRKLWEPRQRWSWRRRRYRVQQAQRAAHEGTRLIHQRHRLRRAHPA